MASDPNACTGVQAPAKINLFLHVTGRRDDGYHLLQSLFVPLDWCDTLHLRRRDDGLLRRHDLGPALPDDDLCLRAARAFQQASGSAFGADIWVDKALPSGAGLGGGSSDAAAVLRTLNRLWGLDWPPERLAALGLTLGADVPFFLQGQPAWVEGVGERLRPVTIQPRRFVLLKPPQGLSTPQVFRALPASCRTPPVSCEAVLAHDAAADLCDLFGHNDLQGPAVALEPQVQQALDWLQAQGLRPRMSGSGSTVFAVLPPAHPAPELPAPWQDAGWLLRVCAMCSPYGAKLV
ncbi:4-(cytidine 5'-diphospho)-2-C-methyl-D-erythritol kinase [Amphibiibacter pelophylacis]|uniref:4-(cytidine 5'-diphospho)-2-C-methyl-D-erythritol kinase n=1 Tax=Amphibiibacter pelophylacis TaxID=1799477 RepID=UPI003BFA7397